MLRKLGTLCLGVGMGAGGHFLYHKYNPQQSIPLSSRETIDSFVSNNQLEKGYLINVLRAVSLMLKGFYHYSLVTKLQAFAYHTCYLKQQEVRDNQLAITRSYCIFSPTDYICGHPEIQHGGATATVIDQNMGELAILHSQEMVATADLSIKYRKPVRKGQFYVLESRVLSRQGRRIEMSGQIRDLETGEVAVDSNAVFMTVKWNNQMTRIFTKFFQVVNYKDYAEDHPARDPGQVRYQVLPPEDARQEDSDRKIERIEGVIEMLKEEEKKLLGVPNLEARTAGTEL